LINATSRAEFQNFAVRSEFLNKSCRMVRVIRVERWIKRPEPNVK